MKFGYAQRLKVGMVLFVFTMMAVTLALMAIGLIQAFKYQNYWWLPWVPFGLWAMPRFVSGARKLLKVDSDDMAATVTQAKAARAAQQSGDASPE